MNQCIKCSVAQGTKKTHSAGTKWAGHHVLTCLLLNVTTATGLDTHSHMAICHQQVLFCLTLRQIRPCSASHYCNEFLHSMVSIASSVRLSHLITLPNCSMDLNAIWQVHMYVQSYIVTPPEKKDLAV